MNLLRTIVGLILLLSPAATFAQDSLTLKAPTPPPPAYVGASYSGQSGPASYYYWVSAVYPGGESGVAGPAPVRGAANTLSGSNTVTISWTAAFGATSYNVIRTETPVFPGNCPSCLLASGLTATTTTDSGAALSAYTSSSAASPATGGLAVNVRDYASPRLEVRLNEQVVASFDNSGIASGGGSGGGSGSVVVRESDSSPSVDPTTVLEALTPDFVISDEGGGVARLALGTVGESKIDSAIARDSELLTVADEGTNLTKRAVLNFTGDGVSCADDAGNTRTNCTITGGGGGSGSEIMTATWQIPAGLSSDTYSHRIPADGTVTKVWCRAPSGDTFDIQIVQREIGVGTSNTFSSAQTCDDSPAEISTFNDGSLAEGDWLELSISNVTGSPADEDELYVYLEATTPGGTVSDDAIDTDKLDDGSNTPVAGKCVVVDTGGSEFDYEDCLISGDPDVVDTTSQQTLEAKTLTDPSLGDDSGWTRRVQNDGSVGTTVNRLAKIQEDGANAEEAVIAGTSDTGIPVWVVSSGAGTTGNAELTVSGEVQADADGACDVEDNVVASTSTGGEVTCTPDPIAQNVFCVGVATQKIASAGLVDVAIGDLCTRAAESGDDADAIHDDVSGEIAALTEKGSPVSGDLLIIEDSEASNAKKKVQIGNLPGSSADFADISTFLFEEEFCGGDGGGFDYDWFGDISATTGADGESNHPCVALLATPSGSSEHSSYLTHSSFRTFNDMSAVTFDSIHVVKPTGYAGTAGNGFWIGFWGGAAAGSATDAIWVKFESGDTNWQYETCASSTCTTTDSGVAYSSGSWINVRIRATSAGSILFSINGGSESTLSTNVPTANLTLAYAASRGAAGAVTLLGDLAKVKINITR